MADISNPSKQWETCKLWTDLLFVEFFAQGDLEKINNFPVSLFYDRATTNLAKTQLGFIDFIIKPAFTVVSKILTKLEFIEKRLDDNRNEWVNQTDAYEE